MKTLIFWIVILLGFSCKTDKQAEVAFVIPEKDLIPEGIAYAPSTNSFYVSSIFKTKIVRIDAGTGKSEDFVPGNALQMSYLGMIADEKRGFLWACGNFTVNNKNSSSINKFDLKSGILIKSYNVNDTASLYNDLVSDDHGNIYFTDSYRDRVCMIDAETDSVSVFFQAGKDQLPYANGITISPDNKLLYIASGLGIHVLDITSRMMVTPPDTSAAGIDGLKYYKNSLIGIRNGFQDKNDMKIVQYKLDETGLLITGTEIIDSQNPLFNIPTTFTLADNYLYCIANSQLDNVNFPLLEIKRPAELEDIRILKYKL